MSSLRILIAHNAYQQRGGEDSVAEAEAQLLAERGHEVVTYQRHNEDLKSMNKLSMLADTFWSRRTVSEVSALIKQHQPDLIHAHNTFPLISPALYWAADQAKVPVVQTLHNFRLMCLNGVYLRDGHVCEDCAGKVPWRGVVRKCYRDSSAQSAVLASMLMLHRGLGTYRHKVARYIALNEFCRQKFIEGGLPAQRIVVKPNFVDFEAPKEQQRSGFLFVGRLSVEKGVEVLAEAAKKVKIAEIRVAGTGTEFAKFNTIGNVNLLGGLDVNAVRNEMASAKALILPSVWYENFPRTLVEAFASGLPVIASRIGALAELIEEGVAGLLFEPGNADDLAAKLQWAQQNPERMSQMGRNARKRYEAEYTADLNYDRLIAIYRDAIKEAGDQSSHETEN